MQPASTGCRTQGVWAQLNLKRTVVFLLGKVPSWHSIANRTSYPTLSLFTKVLLAFSCKPPKVACFQNFLLTKLDLCGSLFQQFNITYLLRVSARLLKEPEQVFNFLSLHNEPEPRPSRKGWSGSGCCVAIFYCQIQHRTLKTERPSAWDTRR